MAGKKVLTAGYVLKNIAMWIFIITIAAFTPTLLKRVDKPDLSTPGIDVRVATDEVRIAELEAQVKLMEDEKIGEQFAEIRMELKGILLLLSSVAMFMFTSLWEQARRLRGETRTRSSD
jgi:hypothetical protein